MEYFIIENGQQAGPFTIAQLAEKHITSETLVWTEGMANWTPAWQVKELRYILGIAGTGAGNASSVPPVPPTPPIAPSTTATEQPATPNHFANTDQSQQPRKKGGKTLWKIILALIVFILAIFAFTNPGEEAHKQTVQRETTEAIEKATATSDNNFFTQGLRSIAKMMAGNFLGEALDQFFEYHNYILFSKGTVTYQGREHAVSFGILGKVYTMNSDDIINALEKNDNLEIEESSSSSMDNASNGASETDNMNSADQQNNDGASDTGNSLEDKANQAIDKISDKVSKKVEDKINQKIDEVTDSSTIEKVIDKILNLL